MWRRRGTTRWTRQGRSFYVEVATFLGHLLSLALPLTMIQVFDRVIPAQGHATLAVLALFLLGAALAETAVRAAAASIQLRRSSERELERTTRLLHNTLYSRHTLSEEPDPVETRALFETIERLRGLEAGETRSSRFDLPFAFAFVGVFVLIAPSLAWALFMALSLLMLQSRWTLKLDELHDQRLERTKRIHDFLGQAFTGIESIKGIHAEQFLLRRFEALSAGAAHLTGRIARGRGARRARGEVASHALPVFMALAGAWSVTTGQMTAGTLAAAILLSGRAVQPLMRTIGARDARRGLAPAAKRLEAALAAPVLTGGDLDAPPLERLEAQNITVRDENEVVRLEDVNVRLLRGGTLAVTGGSGSGKSLLLRVLSGRLIPDAGCVLWNGTPIERFDTDSLHQRIMLLHDLPRLPAVSVIDYLSDGDRTKHRAALNATVELGIAKDLAISTEGLMSRVDTAGSEPVPSLEARLPIARAVSRAPDLILFDDANNTLDADADARVLRALSARERGMALVIASARPSYLRLATESVRLNAGRSEPPVQWMEGAA